VAEIRSFDVIIVGGGAVGLAAAVEAARRGRSVLVLEGRDFHGDHGSSGGWERQWRLQYAERDLAALTLHARTAWRELESLAQRRLVHETGSLWFGDTLQSSSEGQIQAAAQVLDDLGIAYQPVDGRKLRTAYGFQNLPAGHEGIYQPEGGVIDVAAARWALLMLAHRGGVTLHEHEPVTGVEVGGGGARVRTGRGEYRSEQVILTGGAGSVRLLAGLGVSIGLTAYRLTSTYFRVRGDRDYPTWFAFQPATAQDSNLFYGFGRMPWSPRSLVQVSPLFEDDPVVGSTDAPPRQHHLRRVADWVRTHLPDLDPEIADSRTCVAVLPDDHDRQFYLGTADGLIPHGERIVACAGGWGFKFVSVFGQACVDLALNGRTGYDIQRCGLGSATTSAAA
jgi:sarcosine oxidase